MLERKTVIMEPLKKKQKKMDLLSAVEHIVDKAKDSGLNAAFYRKADRYIKYVSNKLELTKEQSVMMALFINNSEDSSISISDFGEYVGCSTTRILRYLNDIDELEKREFIRCCRESCGQTYRVPHEVVEAFRHDEKYVPDDCSNLTCSQFFCELEDIFNLRRENELTYDRMVMKIDHLLECNKELLFVKKMRKYQFKENDELLFLLFCHLFVNNNDDNIRYSDLEDLYGRERRFDWTHIKAQLYSESHTLLSNKLIEFNNDDGFVDRESFRMTKHAKQELFPELNLNSLRNSKQLGDIKPCDIVEKPLFYENSIQKQITELRLLLEENHYQEIRSRLKDSGFRCGFTCLFYGEPGTGKTETALQLAKQTGRNIMQVNISEIKSMWVGESEKNIKQIFDSYRAKVKQYETTPILLFNEADAIINKRMEGTQRAVDKMENTIQNIILQEMETLDGILIATTNLAQNMDKAFERRFLYKIKFTKPTIEARTSIWHFMIPSLSDSDVRSLAMKYDFSGGQIENIARHYSIENILHGTSENILESLFRYCENESLDLKEKKKIGFC